MSVNMQMDTAAGMIMAAGNTTAAPTTQRACVITSHTLEFCWFVFLFHRLLKQLQKGGFGKSVGSSVNGGSDGGSTQILPAEGAQSMMDKNEPLSRKA